MLVGRHKAPLSLHHRWCVKGLFCIMKKQIITFAIALIAATMFTSCSKEQGPVRSNDQIEVERNIESTAWYMTNEQMPSQSMKDAFDRMEFEVSDGQGNDPHFTWSYLGKPGKPTYIMEGTFFYDKTSHKHESGSSIYNTYLYVTHINGQSLPGAYSGIFTFEDKDHWVLNVEPDVQNWEKHPLAENGIGSGANGESSVYAFTVAE